MNVYNANIWNVLVSIYSKQTDHTNINRREKKSGIIETYMHVYVFQKPLKQYRTMLLATANNRHYYDKLLYFCFIFLLNPFVLLYHWPNVTIHIKCSEQILFERSMDLCVNCTITFNWQLDIIWYTTEAIRMDICTTKSKIPVCTNLYMIWMSKS